MRLLAPRLTADNLHLLLQARYKSKHQVQELIARHRTRCKLCPGASASAAQHGASSRRDPWPHSRRLPTIALRVAGDPP